MQRRGSHCEQDVFGFQVSVHHALRVEVGDPVDQLLHDQLDVALDDRRAIRLPVYDKREEIATRGELGEEVSGLVRT